MKKKKKNVWNNFLYSVSREKVLISRIRLTVGGSTDAKFLPLLIAGGVEQLNCCHDYVYTAYYVNYITITQIF